MWLWANKELIAYQNQCSEHKNLINYLYENIKKKGALMKKKTYSMNWKKAVYWTWWFFGIGTSIIDFVRILQCCWGTCTSSAIWLVNRRCSEFICTIINFEMKRIEKLHTRHGQKATTSNEMKKKPRIHNSW